MVTNVVLTKEENWIISTDKSTGIASQGKTDAEALTNLREALALYAEEDNGIVATLELSASQPIRERILSGKKERLEDCLSIDNVNW